MKKIKIWRDECPSNPFTDWDCEPNLMWEGGRNYGQDYSKGEIAKFIAYFPSDGQIIKHQKQLAYELGIDLEYFKQMGFSKDDKISDIRSAIRDASLAELVTVCELFKIPHTQYTSTGYSQGDWADVLIVLTDEFFERTGCDKKNSDSILEGTANLFNAYMWGDVFGYTIYEGREMVKLSRKDFESGTCDNVENEIDWEVTDSCGGFYGTNFLTNGILDELDPELREQALASDEHSIY
jgi:hypothetical protein